MRHVRLFVILAILVSISILPAGKGGSGRQSQAAGGSFVQIVVDGQPFTHVLTPGELAEEAGAALALLIDSHPAYQASVTTVPPRIFENDDVFIEVLTQSGGEIVSLAACENDGTYENSGVSIAGGRPRVEILKPTVLAGDGSFNIRFDMLIGPNVDETFSTTGATLSLLIEEIISTLEGLGFQVIETGTHLIVTKSGDSFNSVRVSSTDEQITETCVEITSTTASPGIPALQPGGLIVLIAGLLLTGILILRRKARA